jgi:hypothetical protein
MMNLGFAHGQIQVPRACFPSSTDCSYRYAFYISACDLIRCTYLNGITHDGLPILDKLLATKFPER